MQYSHSNSNKIMVVGIKPRSLLNFRGKLLDDMAKLGYDVIACSSPAPQDIIDRLEAMNVSYRSVPFQRIGLSPIQDIKSLKQIRKIYQIEQPDKVLLYTVKPVIYGGIASHNLNIDIYSLITGAGYTFTQSNIKQRLISSVVQYLYKLALSSSKAIIFQNPDDFKLFRQRRLLDTNTLSYIVNGSGVDTEHFHPHPLPDKPVFLLLARLLKDKGIEEYVQAARQVRKLRPEARFLLAGPYDSNPSTFSRKDVERWTKEGPVEYFGVVDDVRPLIRQCRIYVLPSYYREGIPRSVLEAMSMGRPVITTDSPGCRETVVNGHNGLLVRPKDAAHLAESMLSLIDESKENIDLMSMHSRQRAVTVYDSKKVNKEMLKIMGLSS